MSILTSLTQRGLQSPAWHLLLDKVPFDARDGVPVLSKPDERGKLQSIKADRLKAIRDVANRVGQSEWPTAIASRVAFHEKLQAQYGPERFRSFTLVNSSRLLLHLGRASALEHVGLYCDRTTGLPVIPGTALKGVASTWACWEANADAIYPEGGEMKLSTIRSGKWRTILGSNDKDGSDLAGGVVFLEAFPTHPPKLEIEIVNPHHDATGKEKDPVPNVFLAVSTGSVWRFSIRGRDAQLAERAEYLLRDALIEIGVGAKTASGFGCFRAQDQAEVLVQKQADQELAAKAEAIKALAADYGNEAEFRNRVLRCADNPGQHSALEKEIPILLKTENAGWLKKFHDHTSGKQHAKLRDKPWYPK